MAMRQVGVIFSDSATRLRKQCDERQSQCVFCTVVVAAVVVLALVKVDEAVVQHTLHVAEVAHGAQTLQFLRHDALLPAAVTPSHLRRTVNVLKSDIHVS